MNNYLALNGVIGKGAYGTPDFPTPETLIEHLDYLGIDRSVVYSLEARDWSPRNGNAELLESIAPYKERLIPSFVITPPDYYEHGTMEFLREKAASGEVRVFRLCPSISRFALYEIERVLAELAEFKPLVTIDVGEIADFRDLRYLAELFPQVNFAICQVMWGSFNHVLDVMWRCRNIFLETSWLHMFDAIEMVRENFGVRRMLFGIGHKSQYGAAIGALAHAAISPEEREMIAHGNLEWLLGLKAVGHSLAVEPPLLAEKPLWNSFHNGGKVEGVRFYDAHVHLCGPFAGGWVMREADSAKSLAKIIGHMEKHGCEKLIMMHNRALMSDPVRGNLEFEELVKAHPGKIAGYFVYNPFYADEMPETVLDEFFSRGFYAGFKLLPGYWKIEMGDARYNPVWEYAEKHHLPILIHTWGDAAALKEIAPRYPNAKFILAHSGGSNYGRTEAVEIAEAAPNAYFEFCGTFCSTMSWAPLIEKFGVGRFVFGSDTGGHNQAYELGAFLSLPLPDRELIPALGENMEKILMDRK